MSIYDLRLAKKKLEAINQQVGGRATEPEEEEEDVDLGKLTPYERGEYKLAMQMKNIRQRHFKLSDESKPINQAERIKLNNQNRREVEDMKKEFLKLKEAARREGKSREMSNLESHLNKTEDLTKGKAVEAGGGRGGRSYGTVAKSMPSGDGPAGGRPMASIQDDPEFSNFLVQIKKKDEMMDEIIDEIGVGVQRLKGTAQTMAGNLQEQDRLLEDIEVTVDKVSGELASLNEKMKSITTSVKKDSCCMYVICLLLLLSILGGIYTLIKT